MHNIRKIKKKKQNTKPLNSQQLAQQKLFQISRFSEEEPSFNEADVFAEKIQTKTSIYSINKTYSNRFIQEHNNLTQFVNNFQKKTKLNQTFSSFRQYRSQSQEISSKKPINLINYVVIDKRENKRQSQEKRKFDSLISIKRRFTAKRNRSQQSYQHELLEIMNPQERLAAFLIGNNENASPIKIKNSKIFNKSSGFRGR